MKRPDKIFGIGLARTGTTSLSRAMKILGYNAIHTPRNFDEVAKYDFCNDLFVAVSFKFLDYSFPKARFILTTRDIDSWVESCRISSKSRGGYHLDSGWLDIPLRRAYARWSFAGITYFDEEIFRKKFVDFHTEVHEHFEDREHKLLILDLRDDNKWDKLCGFLDKPIPDVDYPYNNRKSKYIVINRARNLQ